MDNKKINKALEFAILKHAGQTTKISKIPYITHIFDVMQTLKTNNAAEDTIIAGILHDTLDNTKTTPLEIEALFGKKILKIVQEVSEQKNLPVAERKAEYLSRLKASSIDAKMVFCADMLSNANSLLADYQQLGDEVWKKFGGKKEEMKAYFQNAIEILKIFIDFNGKNAKMYDDLLESYHSMFGFATHLTKEQISKIIKEVDALVWCSTYKNQEIKIQRDFKEDKIQVQFGTAEDFVQGLYEIYNISNFKIERWSEEHEKYYFSVANNIALCKLVFQFFGEEYKKEFEKNYEEFSLPCNILQSLESEAKQ